MAPAPAHHLELRLDQAMPGWRAVAADPDWARWIDAVNPATGCLRRDQLNAAIAQGDVQGIVGTLRRFQQEMHEGWPIREVGDQAWQPRVRVATYTRDNIRQNYERHRRGEYAGREAEWARLEREMINAAKEGRIAGAVPLAKNWADSR